ncbi:MAG: hypothetical protein ACREBG_26895 [Pyrinomonadaceae bacterium]
MKLNDRFGHEGSFPCSSAEAHGGRYTLLKESPVRQKFIRIFLVVVPPLAFVLKDVIATMAVLSTEPGITGKAVVYYRIAMLPGTLWFGAGQAMLFNLIFGTLVGLILYLCVRLKKMWLLSLPPLAFLLKDVIATMAAAISSETEITDKASHYYSIGLLPGSAFHKFGDPILFNIFFGALLGLVLYLRAIRRKGTVPH